MEAENSNRKPSLGHKILVGLAYAAVVVATVLGIKKLTGGFKKNSAEEAAKLLFEPDVVEMGIALIGGGLGVAYGVHEVNTKDLKEKNRQLEIENAVLKSQYDAVAQSKKSWTKAEQLRHEAPQSEQLQK